MLRKSLEKDSISDERTLILRAKKLYASTAGIAATRPIAVAMSASAMPGATVATDADFMAPMARKEFMMPHTVPKRPMKGAAEPVVARNGTFDSRLVISRVCAL